MQPLPEIYHGWVSSAIDEAGISLPQALMLHDDGQLSVHALDLTTAQIYAYLLRQWVEQRPCEMIFALDRFAKPGQGTELGDLMAGYHFTRAQAMRPFIIEYQHDPRIVRPIDWNNAFWNDALRRELIAACPQMPVQHG